MTVAGWPKFDFPAGVPTHQMYLGTIPILIFRPQQNGAISLLSKVEKYANGDSSPRRYTRFLKFASQQATGITTIRIGVCRVTSCFSSINASPPTEVTA
jgi:hypothetical protein